MGYYTEGLTTASRSALLELALTLRSYQDSIVLVGGWVPYFLIEEFGQGKFKHVGSIDIDLAVDPEKVDQKGYAGIVDLIERRGYVQRLSRDHKPILFSFRKNITSQKDQIKYEISVDFLTSRALDTGKHRHRTVQPGFSARVTKGCELAFRHNFLKTINGMLPDNGEAEVEIRMLDIAGCLGMKGIVLGETYREKDAYDIFTVVSQCYDGVSSVAKEIKPHIKEHEIALGIQAIRQRFRNIRAEGPAWVANFLFPTDQIARERVIAEVHVIMQEFIDGLQ